MTGTVLRMEKTSIHDGEGLRTVVFLKGCPLRCQWCSTPESQNIQIEDNGSYHYGMQMTAEEVIREVCKDEIFFFHSGGGVTISGGEVLCQAEYAGEILSGCLRQGIHTAVETSLYADYDKVRMLIPVVNAFYIDFKLYDDAAHKKYTGVSNERIRGNLKQLDQEFTGEIHIRIPSIPTVNMTEENMRDTALFLKDLTHVKDVELLPYHRLGVDTYRKMGREYALGDITSPSYKDLVKMAEVVAASAPELPVKIKGEPVHPLS